MIHLRLPAFFLLFIFLLSGATGCAIDSQRVILSYPPEELAIKWSRKYAAPRIFPPVIKPISLVKFEDRRPEKRTLGMIRNGIKLELVVADEKEAVNWVNKAVKIHLEESGYKVTVLEKRPGQARPNPKVESGQRREVGGQAPGLVLSGAILNIQASAFVAYGGDVALEVKLEKDGKEILKKEYTGTGGTGANLVARESSSGRSLSLALASALDKLINDLEKKGE